MSGRSNKFLRQQPFLSDKIETFTISDSSDEESTMVLQTTNTNLKTSTVHTHPPPLGMYNTAKFTHSNCIKNSSPSTSRSAQIVKENLEDPKPSSSQTVEVNHSMCPTVDFALSNCIKNPITMKKSSGFVIKQIPKNLMYKVSEKKRSTPSTSCVKKIQEKNEKNRTHDKPLAGPKTKKSEAKANVPCQQPSPLPPLYVSTEAMYSFQYLRALRAKYPEVVEFVGRAGDLGKFKYVIQWKKASDDSTMESDEVDTEIAHLLWPNILMKFLVEEIILQNEEE